MNKLMKMTMVVIVGLLLCGPMAGAAEEESEEQNEPEDAAPGWEALTKKAEDVASARYTTKDLENRIQKKEDRLEELEEERKNTRMALVRVISEDEQAQKKLEEMDNRRLRDESLLRFQAAKNTRMHTLQASLKAVKDEMERERRELDMLRQLLQSRRIEARLHGEDDGEEAEVSYDTLLTREASRARRKNQELTDRLYGRRVELIEEIVVPLAEPRVPDAETAVMWNDQE